MYESTPEKYFISAINLSEIDWSVAEMLHLVGTSLRLFFLPTIPILNNFDIWLIDIPLW